ncbi:MAG: phosphoribosylanthranilate isomerase [Fimbriimonadaceae bacterium]|nr:phosphoribosylanthranilate isomerase [Fimbriimonadaceae bacterium]
MRVRVKVCCIAGVDEARIAIGHGVDALGLVSAMPSGPGVIDEDTIAAVARFAPPPVATFLLTSKSDSDPIIAQVRRTGVSTAQFVDELVPGAHQMIREALPALKQVQVIHVTGPESLDEALAVAPEVDALLLDSGNPNLAVKELGGTGRVHDWTVSRAIVEQSRIPVFLAGGLKADNVNEALDRVGPYGLDICSGVRTNGSLDPEKLSRFLAAIQ